MTDSTVKMTSKFKIQNRQRNKENTDRKGSFAKKYV